MALSGVVKSGKSLLLDSIVPPPRFMFHTDDLQRLGLKFEDYPGYVIKRLEEFPCFLVVGMQVPRILRKGLEVDCLLWLDAPLHPLTPKQLGFSRGARTIMHKWRREHPQVPVIFAHSVGRKEAKHV